MTTTADRQHLFDAWAHLYDTAPGSPAEQAAYDALTLADVDRRGRQTTSLPVKASGGPRLHPRARLFAFGLLLFLTGLALMLAAMQPTPTVQADLNALPGLALYLLGFLAVFWAVFAPIGETHD